MGKCRHRVAAAGHGLEPACFGELGCHTKTGLNAPWPVELLGKALISLASIQVFLGIAALAVTQGKATVGSPTTIEVTMATAHQATGALLLAVSVALAAWTRRLLRPTGRPVEG